MPNEWIAITDKIVAAPIESHCYFTRYDPGLLQSVTFEHSHAFLHDYTIETRFVSHCLHNITKPPFLPIVCESVVGVRHLKTMFIFEGICGTYILHRLFTFLDCGLQLEGLRWPFCSFSWFSTRVCPWPGILFSVSAIARNDVANAWRDTPGFSWTSAAK